MRNLILLGGLILSANLYAQSPLVKEWDMRYGGTAEDIITSFDLTSDGGYILGGYSSSGADGNKTDNNRGLTDYWMVKTDSLGNYEWDKRFGGAGDDKLMAIQQTAEGGYILGGWSESDSGGDKTQDNWNFYADYWIIKTDADGNKLWDRRYGRTYIDQLFALQQTSDGGYILGGWSVSDIGGDKTQDAWALGYDYWIVKTDSVGDIEWDKRFGGLSYDHLYALEQTADNGYILGGWSQSDANGDKTEPGWGGYDFWIVKTDTTGNCF